MLIVWAGVTSFNIDFAAKKVTVVGDVTPLSVLASISKVKNAQIWPTSASAVGSGITEAKKQISSNWEESKILVLMCALPMSVMPI